ncbi:hypothetical protein GOP47_0022348 [Adiantum capillus-veneris]|uniref:Solute carrier family 40 member n=1 Tax=Adiantum capillus-veneris TaxID=13818 RepID=A0A9D4Z595_ADICA|nr:hypothetical protein GOP47_0022348 [Adiantum capillus-veneris]
MSKCTVSQTLATWCNVSSYFCQGEANGWFRVGREAMAVDIAFHCSMSFPLYVGTRLGPYCCFSPCHRTTFVHTCLRSRFSHKLSRGNRRSFITKNFVQELFLDVNHTCTDENMSQDSHSHETSQSVGLLEADSKVASEDNPAGQSDTEAGVLLALPTLQVQSIQEQEALAATPAHPEGLIALYTTFFSGNFIEQVWNFAWPSAIALLHNSLLPVAVISFVSKLVIFACGPWVGAKMDSLPRVFAFNTLSIVQTVAQLISAGAIIYALKKSPSLGSSTHSLLLQPWFLILVAMQAIERLTGLACGVAFERDWVVLLAGANRPIALADANAMLCRVDYLCEMTGTSLYGILLSMFSPITCLKIAAAIMIASLPIMIVLACCTNQLSKGVLERPKLSKVRELLESQSHSARTDGLEMLKRGWIQYLSQPALPVSLAAVFLFFNVALAPGSLMTSFLTQQGMNPSIIGAFSGIGALMGFGATFLSTTLVRKLGLLRSGAVGLVFQASLLAVAVLIYWSNSMRHLHSLQFFLAAIVLSRLGHFTYDIIGGQILQTAVHSSEANTVGTTEVSLASLAELVMLGVAIIANDVSHFGCLAALSLAAVVGATVAYYRWMSNTSALPTFDLSLND